MSGICGIVFLDNDCEVEKRDLLPMLDGLNTPCQSEDLTVSLGPVAMAVKRSPGHHSGLAGTILQGRALGLAFHGSLYNLSELFAFEKQPSNPYMGLLGLYLREGLSFLHRLRGEFALSLWDGREKTFYLATDRFRVCPLFYYQDTDKLIYASSMKGILACPVSVTRTINPAAIVDLVGSSVIPTSKTIFREISKLPPGHVLIYHRSEIRVIPYWEMDFVYSDGISEAELGCKLKAYFADAVRVRLQEDGVSDRIGTFLSGGVDSSTVAGVLTQLTRRPIKCFSIGFDEQRFNEINYARIAARAFGADHYEYIVTPKDTYNVVPILLDSFDEPFANASAVPTYFCAKMAREHGVDILYAGDGGDELFAGNERYATQRLFDYYGQIPAWLRRPLIEPLSFGVADRLGCEPFVMIKKYIKRANIPYPERLSSYGFFRTMPMIELLNDEFLVSVGESYNPYAHVEFHYHQAHAQTELDRQLYIDLKVGISDNDLFKVNRMTQAAGVTVRFPFLDHRLAEFATSVPARIKMRGRRLRSFFKETYADLLPLTIRKKKKHGFGLPIPIWLRTDKQLNEMMIDLVLSPQAVQRGYFRKKTLETLVERHKSDETSFYGTLMWNLMMLEVWFRHQQSHSLGGRIRQYLA